MPNVSGTVCCHSSVQTGRAKLWLPLMAAGCCTSDSMSMLPQNGSLWFAMRHGVRKARLGRPADQRKALLRGLVTELIRHGKIRTTKVRGVAAEAAFLDLWRPEQRTSLAARPCSKRVVLGNVRKV